MEAPLSGRLLHPHPQLPVPISSLHSGPQAFLLPTLSKPVHSTILASVLISARTQSGQSRSPQNRNLCKRVRWEMRLQEGLRCGQDPKVQDEHSLVTCSPLSLDCLEYSIPPDLVLTFTVSAQQTSVCGSSTVECPARSSHQFA